MKHRKSGLSFILLVALVLVWFLSYSKVPFIFFQQDELMGFGLFILKGVGMLYTGLGFKEVVHFVPVTMSISYSIFNIFGLNHIPYNIIGLLFHSINGFLIYMLSSMIFKNKLYSLLAVILFFSYSAGNEFVMWPVINLNTISLSFALLAVYTLINSSIKNSNLKVSDFVKVSILFLLAVFSVEYAAGLIFIIPVIGIILDGNKKFLDRLKSQIPFYITVVGYLVFRFLPALFSDKSTSLKEVVDTGIIERIFGMLRLPFVYIAQAFFGQNVIIGISQFISNIFYGNTANTQFAENYIYKNVAIVIGIFIIFFIYKYAKIQKQIIYVKYIAIFLLFILFSSLPFVLVPGTSFSIIPSRYLYFGGVGYAYLLTLLLFLQKKKIYSSILIALLVISGTYQNYKKSNELYFVGKERIRILNSIKNIYPKLPQKVVFYTESNRSYYGLPDSDKILPFQSGLGQTLALWYYDSERYSTNFFKNKFLWGILSEGYKEEDSRGFGYFRDYEKLRDEIRKSKLKPESVIAYKWDYYTNSLTDITEEVRKKLNNEIDVYNKIDK